MDDSELNLDFPGDALFTDMETGERISTQVPSLRTAYKKSVESFVRDLKRRCFENDIDYSLLTTSTPFDKALTAYLMRRKENVLKGKSGIVEAHRGYAV